MSEFYTRPLDQERLKNNPDFSRRVGAAAVELWFRTDDGLDMRISRENTRVFLNDVAPEMDSFTIEDPRDQTSWVRFRDEYEGDGFNDIIDQLHPYCRVIADPEPDDQMLQLYENRLLRDLSQADTLPNEWSEA